MTEYGPDYSRLNHLITLYEYVQALDFENKFVGAWDKEFDERIWYWAFEDDQDLVEFWASDKYYLPFIKMYNKFQKYYDYQCSAENLA